MTAAIPVTVAAAVPTDTTFGRDGALFEALLAFVAQMSLVLWALVIVTVLFRFVGIRVYRRAARRGSARKAAVVPPPVDLHYDLLPPAVTAVIDAAVEATQPAVAAVMDAAGGLVQPPEARPVTASAAPAAGALSADEPPSTVLPPTGPAPIPAAGRPALAAHGAGAAITLPYRRTRDRHAAGRPDEHLPAMSARAVKP